ncbi:hypothetical protein HOY80DRAFT_1081612 [Tuber brumale]|nr:hypothetical protein HOY80DRAFT_1081612 [Tuber brumale]
MSHDSDKENVDPALLCDPAPLSLRYTAPSLPHTPPGSTYLPEAPDIPRGIAGTPTEIDSDNIPLLEHTVTPIGTPTVWKSRKMSNEAATVLLNMADGTPTPQEPKIGRPPRDPKKSPIWLPEMKLTDLRNPHLALESVRNTSWLHTPVLTDYQLKTLYRSFGVINWNLSWDRSGISMRGFITMLAHVEWMANGSKPEICDASTFNAAIAKEGNVIVEDFERETAVRGGRGGGEGSAALLACCDAVTKQHFLDDLRLAAPRLYLASYNNVRCVAEQHDPTVETKYLSPYGSSSWNLPTAVEDWCENFLSMYNKDSCNGFLSVRPLSLVLYGPTRTGKTAWACSLDSHIYFSGMFNFSLYREMYRYVVFDDVEFSRMDIFKCWFWAQEEFTATDKYCKKTQEKIYIVLENGPIMLKGKVTGRGLKPPISRTDPPDGTFTKGGPDTIRRHLAEALDIVWTQDIEGDFLEKLWESMPRRVAAVLDAKGWYTKY